MISSSLPGQISPSPAERRAVFDDLAISGGHRYCPMQQRTPPRPNAVLRKGPHLDDVVSSSARRDGEPNRRSAILFPMPTSGLPAGLAAAILATEGGGIGNAIDLNPANFIKFVAYRRLSPRRRSLRALPKAAR